MRQVKALPLPRAIEGLMTEISLHHERHPMSSPLKPTVYVIDDDDAVLGSLRFLLETDGFAVRTFRNATALLNATSAPEADCYVIDYKMPDINGIELCRQIRQSQPATPILFFSAAAYSSDIEVGLAAGANAYLVKPVDLDVLEMTIRRLIEGSRTPAES